MYIITFYSFKGGVGRTMALVNTGAELARRGRKVLLVDFDLEAPGLSTYDLLRSDEPKPGIVEFVTEFRDTWHSPLVTDFIYEPQKIKKKLTKKGGQLWVMPAGRGDADYRRKLNALNWMKLYKEEDGFLLFEDAKAQWEAELHPDYVLIDARTGHTDIEGICTRQLADAVVLMFTPNEQNLAGLETVCRDIRREATEGLKKKIRLHFVAANVPDLDDEKRILHRQLLAFRERLDFKDLSGVIRRYENLNLLDQSIFTLDRPHTRLARLYRRLLRTLRMDNPTDRNGALMFIGHGGPWGLFEDETVRLRLQQEYVNHLHKIGQHFNDDIDILNRVGTSFIQVKDYRSAVQVFDRVLQMNPANAYALEHRDLSKENLIEADTASENLPKEEG